MDAVTAWEDSDHPRARELRDMREQLDMIEDCRLAASDAGAWGPVAQLSAQWFRVRKRIAEIEAAHHRPAVVTVEERRERVRDAQGRPEYPLDLLEHAVDMLAERFGARVILVRDGGDRAERVDGDWQLAPAAG